MLSEFNNLLWLFVDNLMGGLGNLSEHQTCFEYYIMDNRMIK